MRTNYNLKRIASALAIAAATFFAPSTEVMAQNQTSIPKTITLTREVLMDKIKGGWAGQAIGVTYGGPTEFRYQGRTMADSDKIAWGDMDYISRTMTNWAGLYDDIYMDLTFVEIFERAGIDAPVELLADAFANAKYPLWHANQAARYNILQNIKPPKSGHWRNNPHADDIDYQIEADYAGLMAPAMPNAASKISDKVGHIMNYGDGWYGGVYMGAMYSLAFVTEDVEFIVTEALKTIPAKSKFYRCISDVIATYKAHPNDWRKAWQVCHERWDSDVACSDGALASFNIDASINSAYVVIGLLYGKGDFGRTIDIATRCGQDSDCNPASAGGILATAIGYNRIPAYWLDPLKRAEDIKFQYTSSSLNDTYRMSFSHALQVIERNGGKIDGDKITIKCQQPKPVRFEQSFPGLEPRERIGIGKNLSDSHEFNANCKGIVIRGNVKSNNADYIALVEVTIDGKVKQISKMPADSKVRKLEIFWDFELKEKPHTILLRWLNPTEGASVWMNDALLLQSSK